MGVVDMVGSGKLVRLNEMKNNKRVIDRYKNEYSIKFRLLENPILNEEQLSLI